MIRGATALFTIAPNVPTAVTVLGSGTETPQSPSATPLCSWFQELPPSVVRRTMSPKPTAVPLFAPAKEIAVRINVPGGVLGTQLFPPSVVWRIMPSPVSSDPPTATPWFVSVNQTPLRPEVVPLVCVVQLLPPFVVLMIAPFSPTAVPVFMSVKETPKRKVAAFNPLA